MAAGDTLTFDYYYSSENNYDWYRFKANGTEVQQLSGTGISDFASYTYTAASDGAYTFEWSYSKDSSVNGGNDCVKLDNVASVSYTHLEPRSAAGIMTRSASAVVQWYALHIQSASLS